MVWIQCHSSYATAQMILSAPTELQGSTQTSCGHLRTAILVLTPSVV